MKIGNFFLVFIVLGGYFLWKYQGYLKGLLATIPAPSGTVKSAIAKYATSILLVAVILVVVFLGIFSSVWESLSFAAVSKWAWSYWALIAIVATACSALIALHKKELGAAAQVLQTALSLTLVFVFIVCYAIGWFEGPSTRRPQAAMSAPKECSKARPCLGSIERVSIPKGKGVCFEGSFLDNKSRLGFWTSYQGGPEWHNICSQKLINAGVCDNQYDSFRFAPENGVPLPQYWIVTSGGQC